MEGLKDLLVQEQEHLGKVVQIVRERLQNAPEGALRISSSDSKVTYYHCTEKNPVNGVYIPKENQELIQQLAQKAYDKKVLNHAEKRLEQITRFIGNYDDHEIENIFQKEHIERKKLIHPVEPIWEQRFQKWMEEKYQGKEFQEGVPFILTERGERVRSKSEKIMADYFYQHGIAYKYEHPLYLKGVGTVYPDFTFLSQKVGTEIYWEHNGKMDDPNYARLAVKKIQAYEKNDIFVGEKLIVTYETSETILNTKTIEKIVNKYLI